MYKIQLFCVKQSKNKLFKKENTMKKIVGAVLIASVFGASGAYALCVEDCSAFSIGVGGLYSKFNGSNAGVESNGGYVSAEAYKITGRVKTDVRAQLGWGNSSLQGASVSGLSNPPNHFFTYGAKIGVNIASKNVPIFVSFFGELDRHDTSNSKGFERKLITIGAEIDGIIPAGNALSVTYSLGYGWIGSAYYKFDGVTSKANASGNYMIKASVGALYALSDSVSAYLRVIGKYQNIARDSQRVSDANNFYPKSASYVGMVELGLEF